jgi:vacuolar-type H+-ATPase subunit E/Vma4
MLTSSSATSHSINQNRLKLLKAREDLIFKLYNDAKQQLNTVSRDPNTYKALVKLLILQVRHATVLSSRGTNRLVLFLGAA